MTYTALMQLFSFGKVRLSDCDFSRPKPLLLLSYVTLEGPQERRRLADLFWIDTDTEHEVSKKLGKLSVVLAQFKKAGVLSFPDTPGVDPLPSLVTCDALEFLSALEKNDFKKALEPYQGPFLHDLGKPLDNLEVSDEVLEWVLEKREFYGDKARSAMLQLAEEAHEAGEKKDATMWAEKAFGLSEAPEMEPAQLSRLQYLLGVKSEVKKKVAKAVQASLDEVSTEAREVFLALSLQNAPHLAVIREALKISIDVLSQAREELLLSGLVDFESRVLAKDMAKNWLTQHPAERVPLMMKVVRATPANEAFDLYHGIYTETKGFGGIGDLQKARKAYQHTAERLMDVREFAATIETLSELRETERLYEAEPEAQCRFLEAYALERLGRFKESFELLQTLNEQLHDPNITALKSVLLWRLGKSEEAKVAAEKAHGSGLDWLWARATATNTLGYLASSSRDFRQAASHFKKASSLYQAAGDTSRWVGSLNNYAVELDKMALGAETEGEIERVVAKMRDDAELAYQHALEALNQIDGNDALRARILLNLGVLCERRKDWTRAEAFYLEATTFAENESALEIAARLQLNLGLVYFQLQLLDKAKISFTRAVDTAAKAGEYFIQGSAMGYLATATNDVDAMEVALELIKQSGRLDRLHEFQKNHEFLLKHELDKALAANDGRQSQDLLIKLGALYQEQEKANKVAKVEDALNVVAQALDLSGQKTLLLAMLNGLQNGSSMPS
jgi:tetratricopeptide (TPR) repeat protein